MRLPVCAQLGGRRRGRRSGWKYRRQRRRSQRRGSPATATTFRETTDLLTSVTGRVGYAWNNWLFYGKGGAAWASRSLWRAGYARDLRLRGIGNQASGGPPASASNGCCRHDWSVKLEYDYYGFGTRSVTFIDNVSGTVGPLDIKQNIQIVKLGFNFHVLGRPGRGHSGGEKRWALGAFRHDVRQTTRGRAGGQAAGAASARDSTTAAFVHGWSRGRARRRGRRVAARAARQDRILRKLSRRVGRKDFTAIIRSRGSPGSNRNTSKINSRLSSSAGGPTTSCSTWRTC